MVMVVAPHRSTKAAAPRVVRGRDRADAANAEHAADLAAEAAPAEAAPAE